MRASQSFSCNQWRLPPTHDLVYSGERPIDLQEAKRGVGCFLVYALGVIHGCELQLADWYVRGPKSTRMNGFFIPLRNTVSIAMTHLATWYSRQKTSVQTAMTSALYLHNEIPSFFWDWERFAWQHMVFDTCWFVASTSGAILADPLKPVSHSKRLMAFAQCFRIRPSPEDFNRWVHYRNELFHQITWGGSVPGHHPDTAVHGAYILLRHFSTLALLAATGFDSPSLHGDWKVLMAHGLEPPESHTC